MACQAKQHSDQMLCHRCALAWDVNDAYPPVCHTHNPGALRRQKERHAAIRYAKHVTSMGECSVSVAVYSFIAGFLCGLLVLVLTGFYL